MFFVLAAAVLVVFGTGLVVLGALAWAERLHRNRWVGVRTPAAMSCAEAFNLANKVAGPTIVTAGVLLIVAAAGWLGLDGLNAAMITVFGLAGALVMLIAGGRLGDTAARALTSGAVPAGPHSRCAECTGCELMSSIRA